MTRLDVGYICGQIGKHGDGQIGPHSCEQGDGQIGGTGDRQGEKQGVKHTDGVRADLCA